MLQLDWITLAFAMAAAFTIGVIADRLWTKYRGQDTTSLKRQLDDLKRQHQHYQISVTEHFKRTTELIDNLNRNYNAIRDHLNQGADELVAPEYRLETARDANKVDLQDLVPAQKPKHDPDRPRDYAPKAGRAEGTLSETYGLRKAAFSEEPESRPDPEAVEPVTKDTQ